MTKRYFSGEYAVALPGQVGNAQNAVTSVTERNKGATAIKAGCFVVLNTDEGVNLPANKADKLLGVVLRSAVNDSYEANALMPVATLRAGDSVWVLIKQGQTFSRGDTVSVEVSGDTAGQATKEDSKLKTKFVVLNVADNLALITPI